jgi:hypothetical protein
MRRMPSGIFRPAALCHPALSSTSKMMRAMPASAARAKVRSSRSCPGLERLRLAPDRYSSAGTIYVLLGCRLVKIRRRYSKIRRRYSMRKCALAIAAAALTNGVVEIRVRRPLLGMDDRRSFSIRVLPPKRPKRRQTVLSIRVGLRAKGLSARRE